MDEERDVQQTYMEIQQIEQQLKQLREHQSVLGGQFTELQKLREGLDEVGNVKEGSASYMPLGSGIFIEGEIKNTKRIIMNVGADVAVIKSLDKAKQTLDTQLAEVQKILERLDEDMGKMTIHGTALQEELRVMMREKKR